MSIRGWDLVCAACALCVSVCEKVCERVCERVRECVTVNVCVYVPEENQKRQIADRCELGLRPVVVYEYKCVSQCCCM